MGFNIKLKSHSMFFALAALTTARSARAQFFSSGYDDYGAFASDPTDLDTEVSDLFGRFFQNSLHIGTSILTGDLGAAYSAGLLAELKFIFYFDKIWAGELGIGWAQYNGIYNSTNTGVAQGIDITEKMSMVPVQLGVRYGFDQDVLPRGFAILNPYISVDAEYIFRSEGVVGTATNSYLTTNQPTLAPNFATSAVFSSQGFGVNFGSGIEFNVYRKKLLMGIDVRYHLLFWSDADVLIGKLGRQGNAVSILGTLTYNY